MTTGRTPNGEHVESVHMRPSVSLTHHSMIELPSRRQASNKGMKMDKGCRV